MTQADDKPWTLDPKLPRVGRVMAEQDKVALPPKCTHQPSGLMHTSSLPPGLSVIFFEGKKFLILFPGPSCPRHLGFHARATVSEVAQIPSSPREVGGGGAMGREFSEVQGCRVLGRVLGQRGEKGSTHGEGDAATCWSPGERLSSCAARFPGPCGTSS